IDSLAVDGSKSYVFTVRLDPSYSGDGSDIQNVATSKGDQDDPSPGNDSNTPAAGLPDKTPAPAEADIQTEKKPTTDTPVTPGQTFDYEITVTNNGPSDATNIAVTDALPSQLA